MRHIALDKTFVNDVSYASRKDRPHDQARHRMWLNESIFDFLVIEV